MGYNIELFTIDDSRWKPHTIKVIYDRPKFNDLEGVPDWLNEAGWEWLGPYGKDYGKEVVIFRNRYILSALLDHFGTGEPHLAVSLNKRDSKRLGKALQKILKKYVNKYGDTISGDEKPLSKMIKSLTKGKHHYLYIG